MKLLSVLSLLLSVHAGLNGDSESSVNGQAKSLYVPGPEVIKYAQGKAMMKVVEDFSKEDYAYVFNYFADGFDLAPNDFISWQRDVLLLLRDFIRYKSKVNIEDVMVLLSKSVIQRLSKLMNYSKKTGLRESFQIALNNDICTVTKFLHSLDHTQFNTTHIVYFQNFLGTLISAIINEQRRIIYPKHFREEKENRKYLDQTSEKYLATAQERGTCFESLKKMASKIVKTYSQNAISLPMLVEDDFLDWSISGEEFFQFPNAYGKNIELLHMTTHNKRQETLALHVFSYGSAQAIAKMILLNISLEDNDPTLGDRHTCDKGLLDRLLLNQNLTSADRRVFLEALVPLFSTMNHKCLWGLRWNSLRDFDTYLAEFGFSEALTEEDQKLIERIKEKREPSKQQHDRHIFAYDRWTTTHGERLGLKNLSCPVLQLEQAYNLARRNLLEEKKKEKVCSEIAVCIKEHADLQLWSQMDYDFKSAGATYEAFCETPELKDEKKGSLVNISLKGALSKTNNNTLLYELQRRAQEKEFSNKVYSSLPDENFTLRAEVFNTQAEVSEIRINSLETMQKVFYMISESDRYEFVNDKVMEDILQNDNFVKLLQSHSLGAQHAIARAIYLKSQAKYRRRNQKLYDMFMKALEKANQRLCPMLKDIKNDYEEDDDEEDY